MTMVGARQYNRDLRVETRRPGAPRNLSFNSSTMELTWLGPVSGPQFTHFNVRLDTDAGPSAMRLPAGTTSLFIGRRALVAITCWNETVKTESSAARLLVNDYGVWSGASETLSSLLPGLRVSYTLTANVTIAAPAPAIPNQRLLLYIYQHSSTIYTPSFDPDYFVDSASIYIDLLKAWVREYSGGSDGKYYPITAGITFDPSI